MDICRDLVLHTLNAASAFLLTHDYVSVYFFSAVFQGNMALVGITAIFAIFKLQNLGQEANLLFSQIKSRLQYYAPHVLSPQQIDKELYGITRGKGVLEKMTAWRDADKNHFQRMSANLLSDQTFQDLIVKESALRDLHNTYLERMADPFRWTIGLCIGSLFALFISDSIQQNFPVGSVLLFIVTLVSQVVVLLKLKRFAFLSLVEYQFQRESDVS